MPVTEMQSITEQQFNSLRYKFCRAFDINSGCKVTFATLSFVQMSLFYKTRRLCLHQKLEPDRFQMFLELQLLVALQAHRDMRKNHLQL